MTPLGAIVFFAIVWWLVFFTVLPWGVRSHEEAGADPLPGSPRGIPHRPQLIRKAVVTTGITLVLLVIFWVVVDYDLLGYREFMEQP